MISSSSSSTKGVAGIVRPIADVLNEVLAMAVVLRLSDRRTAAAPRSGQTGPLPATAAILILPCIRREPLDRHVPPRTCDDMPAQLQA